MSETKEIIGRTTCPICGEPMQDVKINKNNNLYTFCDNRCKFQFNPKMSRQAIALLRQGKTAAVGKIRIVPVGDCSNFAVDDDDDDF